MFTEALVKETVVVNAFTYGVYYWPTDVTPTRPPLSDAVSWSPHGPNWICQIDQNHWTPSVDVLKSYSSKESYDTPGWHDLKRSMVVRFSPKKINLSVYLRKPVVPRFNPPKFKILLPPVKTVKRDYEKETLKINPRLNAKQRIKLRKLSESVHSRRMIVYNLRLERFRVISTSRSSRSEAYRTSYLKKITKYNKLMVQREKRLSIVSKWQQKAQRNSHIRRFPEQDNPYERIKLVSIGSVLPFVAYRTEANHDYLVGYPLYWQAYTPGSIPVGAPRDYVTWLRTLLEEERSANLAFLSNKFYDKLGNQKVHYANMIAERAQTISLFKNAVESLAKLIGGKKKLFSSILQYGKKPRMIADDFLAFKFGVEPLIKDIQGTAEILAGTMFDNDEVVITIRTNTKRQFTVLRSNVLLDGYIENSYVVKYSIENSFARSLQEFGLINPSEIAWELLPWSFVVDWFVPIGNYLKQMTAEVGLTFKTGTLSERIVMTADAARPNVVAGLPFTTSSASFLSGKFALEFKNRVVLAEPPEKMKLLVKNPLSWTHNLEALALIVQKLSK